MDLERRILLEEDGLIVVDKPSGVPTAGDALEQPGSLQYELMQRYRRMIWAVHQLDRDTSGVNVFVRRKALVATWQAALSEGRKTYLGVCHGRLEGLVRVDAPLGWDDEHRRRAVAEGGKSARTEIEVLGATEGFSLLALRIETGRTHQIRLHLEHIGHPLVGERRYRHQPCTLHPHHALHALRVEAGGLVLEAPIPADFRELAGNLGLSGLPQS